MLAKDESLNPFAYLPDDTENRWNRSFCESKQKSKGRAKDEKDDSINPVAVVPCFCDTSPYTHIVSPKKELYIHVPDLLLPLQS